jgi:ATP synthase protein I
MPEPKDTGRDPLGRLDARIEAFESRRGRAKAGIGQEAADGYRLLGQMLGGVLGGVGLGWLLDHFAHTSPWGLVGGLLIGSGLSIFSTIRTAMRISARAAANGKTEGPAPRPEPNERGTEGD